MKLTDDPFGDRFIFESTGRQVYANQGIFGINHKLETYEGYDGEPTIRTVTPEGTIIFGMTKEEKIELSDYMIDLWQQFKNKAESST